MAFDTGPPARALLWLNLEWRASFGFRPAESLLREADHPFTATFQLEAPENTNRAPFHPCSLYPRLSCTPDADLLARRHGSLTPHKSVEEIIS